MRVSIENVLYIDCPEGFHVLSEEEAWAVMNISPGAKALCMNDPVKQIYVTVEWKQINWLSAMFFGRREISFNMERQIQKRLKPFSFNKTGEVKRDIDGKLARGMDYEYVSKGVHIASESLVVTSGEDFYYFHMYARKVRKDESLRIFGEILDSVVIAE